MTYIPIKEKTIDIFTKGLHWKSFDDFICKLDMIDIYDPTKEGELKSRYLTDIVVRN